jgi:hypothetical protein
MREWWTKISKAVHLLPSESPLNAEIAIASLEFYLQNIRQLSLLTHILPTAEARTRRSPWASLAA